ncbi:hypothetical protein TNCT_374451 [Trichonephila clavata]|uniref:Uncharacterized protein n=1 Tax=Trichonephila clavata TaxID=2740835 RepID=A0A8X6IJZ1_TRICU|nr:hypothetical protein TNCT_374451 [Trichonephila clavata]
MLPSSIQFPDQHFVGAVDSDGEWGLPLSLELSLCWSANMHLRQLSQKKKSPLGLVIRHFFVLSFLVSACRRRDYANTRIRLNLEKVDACENIFEMRCIR